MRVQKLRRNGLDHGVGASPLSCWWFRQALTPRPRAPYKPGMGSHQRVLVIQHLAFEDLGLLGPILQDRGFNVEARQAGVDRLDDQGAKSADLLVVLGGPIGVYEEHRYPFLKQELSLIERRLAQDLPTLGICLGAQLMARALGAEVKPGPKKEIGFLPLELCTPKTNKSSVLAPIETSQDRAVLHWHGDVAGLPEGAECLARTAPCPNQAFTQGKKQLALQFHLEVDFGHFERWLIGHAVEIGQAGLDPAKLRADACRHRETLEMAGRACFNHWLDGWQTKP